MSNGTELLVGTVVGFGGETGEYPPTGWLLCDGNAVSRTTYEQLFEAIGTSSGEGDGKTTFNLPDYQGRFLRGVDDGTQRDPNASTRSANYTGGNTGDKVGSIQEYATARPTSGELETESGGEHTHTVDHLPDDSSWYYIAGSHYAKWNSSSVKTSENGEHSHTVDSGGDAESRPENVYVNYIIYYGTTSTDN